MYKHVEHRRSTARFFNILSARPGLSQRPIPKDRKAGCDGALNVTKIGRVGSDTLFIQ
jgi:hypothetical protein